MRNTWTLFSLPRKLWNQAILFHFINLWKINWSIMIENLTVTTVRSHITNRLYCSHSRGSKTKRRSRPDLPNVQSVHLHRAVNLGWRKIVSTSYCQQRLLITTQHNVQLLSLCSFTSNPTTTKITKLAASPHLHLCVVTYWRCYVVLCKEQCAITYPPAASL